MYESSVIVFCCQLSVTSLGIFLSVPHSCLIKDNLFSGLTYMFRDSAHYNHVRSHDSIQVVMELEEPWLLHLDWKASRKDWHLYAAGRNVPFHSDILPPTSRSQLLQHGLHTGLGISCHDNVLNLWTCKAVPIKCVLYEFPWSWFLFTTVKP